MQNNFDFYKLLKEGEVIIPAPEKGKAPAAPAPAAVPGAPAPGTPAPVPTGGFILQAGSYRNLEDADRVKANLALLGVESRIEKAVLKSGETWYRLRIGPLTDPQQVETVRARLKENGINALLIRMDR